jgi:hypothetical protein
VVQAAVAGDPVQPRPGVDGPVVRADRVERGGEDLLEHVLGVLLAAEHVATEGEQAGLVTLNQSLESAVMPAPDERDQALIGLKPKQG